MGETVAAVAFDAIYAYTLELGTATFWATVIEVAVDAAIIVGVNAATQKLSEPDAVDNPGVRQRMPTDTNWNIPIIYGESRYSGTLVLGDLSNRTTTLSVLNLICEGPIEGIAQVTWDDWLLSFRSANHSSGRFNGETNITLEANGCFANENTMGCVSAVSLATGEEDKPLTDNGKKKTAFIVKGYYNGGPCTEFENFSGLNASYAENRVQIASAIWATLVTYNIGDIVTVGEAVYECLDTHTSGTFITDLGTGKWLLKQNAVVSTTYFNNVPVLTTWDTDPQVVYQDNIWSGQDSIQPRNMPDLAYTFLNVFHSKSPPVFGISSNLSYVIKGRKVRVIPAIPGSGTWAAAYLAQPKVYSSNYADCLMDYLLDTKSGCGNKITIDMINIGSMKNYQDFCNELIDHYDANGAVTQAKRYTMNGILDTSQDVDLIIRDILNCSGASLGYSGGQFHIILDIPKASVRTFTLKDIYGNITTSDSGYTELKNNLTMRFLSKQENYVEGRVICDIPATYLPWAANTDYTVGYYVSIGAIIYRCKTNHKSGASFVATNWYEITNPLYRKKNEPELSDTLQLVYVNNSREAEHIGQIKLRKSRLTKVVNFSVDMKNIDLEAGDVITLINKEYQIRSIVENGSQDKITLLEINAKEYDASILDIFTPVDYDGSLNSGIPTRDTSKPSTPTSLFATQNLPNVIQLSWDNGDRRMEALPWDIGVVYQAGNAEISADQIYQLIDEDLQPGYTTYSTNIYKCIVGHTSGATFAADLVAGKWIKITTVDDPSIIYPYVTQIFRHVEDNRDMASLISAVNPDNAIYFDVVPSNTNYYYWVRNVFPKDSNRVSDYNALAGTLGKSSEAQYKPQPLVNFAANPDSFKSVITWDKPEEDIFFSHVQIHRTTTSTDFNDGTGINFETSPKKSVVLSYDDTSVVHTAGVYPTYQYWGRVVALVPVRQPDGSLLNIESYSDWVGPDACQPVTTYVVDGIPQNFSFQVVENGDIWLHWTDEQRPPGARVNIVRSATNDINAAVNVGSTIGDRWIIPASLYGTVNNHYYWARYEETIEGLTQYGNPTPSLQVSWNVSVLNPSGVQATGGFNSISIIWNTMGYTGHDFVRIYRAAGDVAGVWPGSGTAPLLVEIPGRFTFYTDTGLEAETTYTYWVSFVTKWGVETTKIRNMTSVSTLVDPATAIEVLSGSITHDKLATDLRDQIEDVTNQIFMKVAFASGASPWQRNTAYTVGTKVIAGAKVYEANTAHTSQDTFAVDAAKWTVTGDTVIYGGVGGVADASGVRFNIVADQFAIYPSSIIGTDEIVPFIVDSGNVYIDTAIIREATIKQGHLGPIGFGFLRDVRGDWTEGDIYAVGDKVRVQYIDANNKVQELFYIAITAHTAVAGDYTGGIPPSLAAGKWSTTTPVYITTVAGKLKAEFIETNSLIASQAYLTDFIQSGDNDLNPFRDYDPGGAPLLDPGGPDGNAGWKLENTGRFIIRGPFGDKVLEALPDGTVNLKHALVKTLHIDGAAVTIPITVTSHYVEGKAPSESKVNYANWDYTTQQSNGSWIGLTETPHNPPAADWSNEYSLLTFGKLVLDSPGIVYAHMIAALGILGGKDGMLQFVMLMKNNAGEVIKVTEVRSFRGESSPALALSCDMPAGWVTIEVWWRAASIVHVHGTELFFMGTKR